MNEKRSKRKRWIIGLVIVGLVLLGLAFLIIPPMVATRSVVSHLEYRGEDARFETRGTPLEFAVEATPAPSIPSAAPSSAGEPPTRMIIRTANLAIVVEDTETALIQVREVANALNGFVADTNVQRFDDQLRGTVTIRVPAESFDAAMDQIKELAVQVRRENVSGQDVTEEYTDLSAQLRNLEATEEELLVLLTEVREKTRRAEDVLAVHREVTNIRGQIEQIKGRMQYLERMTALATINVELIPEEEEPPIVEEGWQPLRTLRSAFRSLINAGQFFVDAAIWLIVFVVPVLLVLIIPLAIIWFVWRRWKHRRPAKEES